MWIEILHIADRVYDGMVCTTLESCHARHMSLLTPVLVQYVLLESPRSGLQSLYAHAQPLDICQNFIIRTGGN